MRNWVTPNSFQRVQQVENFGNPGKVSEVVRGAPLCVFGSSIMVQCIHVFMLERYRHFKRKMSLLTSGPVLETCTSSHKTGCGG